MKWKEFFKPTWQKFSIFLLLLALYLGITFFRLLLFSSVQATTLSVCSNDFQNIYRDVVLNNTCSKATINQTFTNYVYSVTNANAVLVSFVSNLGIIILPLNLGFSLLDISGVVMPIYWYLLSCALVWIYSAVKKRKKK